MNFFKKTKQERHSKYYGEDILDESDKQTPTSYEDTQDYLVGLSDAEFTKVVEVATICREANTKANAALGVENEPTTFIFPPAAPTVVDSNFTDDNGNMLEDDELDAAFLGSDSEPKQINDIKRTGK